MSLRNGNSFPEIGLVESISLSVLDTVGYEDICLEHRLHTFDSPVGDNHIFQLVKRISKKYSKIRICHLDKEFNARDIGQKNQ